MSTGVHRLLDGTVSFLRTLVARKLLSRTEARVLTTRRDVYERRVAHPASTPRDWDAYIAYEGALLALLRRRAAASRLSLPVGAALVDKAAARVTYLHTRATRANPGHVDGWLAAAAAALAAAPPVQPEGRGGGSRGGSGGGRPAGRAAPARRRIGTAARVLARALALLPREERLWVAAVRLHAVTGDDVRGGRAVALAGLRQVRQSAALWAAYWALEVAYVSRLREQRRVLGVAVPGGGQVGGSDAPEGTDAPMGKTTAAAAAAAAAPPADATVGGDGAPAASAAPSDPAAAIDGGPVTDTDAAPPTGGRNGGPTAPAAGAATTAATSRPLTFWEGGILVAVWGHATAALADVSAAGPAYWARLYQQAAGTRGAPPPALVVLAARLLAAHPSDVGAADAVARGGLTAAELVAAPPPRAAGRGRQPTGAGRGKPDAADGPRAVVDKAGGVPAGVAIAVADGVAAYLRVSPPAVGAAAAALAFAADMRARYAAATPDLVPSDASLVTSYAAAAPSVDLSSLAAAAVTAAGTPPAASPPPAAPLLAAIAAARDRGGATPPGGWEPLVDAALAISTTVAGATARPHPAPPTTPSAGDDTATAAAAAAAAAAPASAAATTPAASVIPALRVALQAAVGCAAASPAARDAAAAAGVRLEAAAGGGLPAARAVVDAATAALPGGAAVGAATAVAALAAEAAAADTDAGADAGAAATTIANRRRRVRDLYGAWTAAVPPASEAAEEAWLEALRWERRPGAGGGGGEPHRVAALLWRAHKALGPLRAATFDQLAALMDVE